MKFGWINFIGVVIVILLLVPNIIYSMKNKEPAPSIPNKTMTIIEQIGRYACIVFMWLPLFTWKFGFRSGEELFVYMGGNAVLIVAYCVFWCFYFKKRKIPTAIVLAVVPTCIFLWSGMLLRHWILVASAILFGVGHIYITVRTHTTN